MTKATSNGWQVTTQFAYVPLKEAFASFAAKFYRDKQICYGLWLASLNPKGGVSVGWGWGGATGTVTGGLERLGELVAMLDG